jgi:hypothetical protein
MSLHDRYNRGDGRIQKLDRYLMDVGNRAGNLWLDWTGWSRDTLTKGLCIVSALAATQHGVLFNEPTVFVFVAAALLSFVGLGQSRGGLVEQIQAEAAGLPKNAIALMRLQVLMIGIWQLAIATGGFMAALSSNLSLSEFIVRPLLLGLALAALQASDYIRRTNPASPSGGGRGHRVLNPR